MTRHFLPPRFQATRSAPSAPGFGWGWARAAVAVLAAGCILATAPALAEEPPLPPGLGRPAAPPPANDDDPPLPPGLGQPARPAEANDDPPLPPGLGKPAPRDEAPSDEADDRPWRDRLPIDLRGYWETRIGPRLQDDPAHSKDATLAEMRLQLRASWIGDTFEIDTAYDAILDGIREKGTGDLRQVRFSWSPLPWMDLRIGRQVLSWGTGDLLFVNDLFPKDWQAFLIGRDEEYLKAPGDAVRVGLFFDAVNIDIVYSPRFDPDRYITGERLSYWNPLFGRRSGEDFRVRTIEPDRYFTNDEWAWRIYRTIGAAEVALYGYDGYWKSPAGQDLRTFRATFPRLGVYGASIRQPLWGGVANAEIGWYDSRDSDGGRNPFVDNSEIRALVGYERELVPEFTAGVQWYAEHMLDYSRYRNAHIRLLQGTPRDRTRHVATVRLTRMLMNQNLTLSLFTFVSPTDKDAYLRPKISYKLTDAWLLEAGGNWFLGRDDDSFFGQFEKNSNLWASVRYSF